VSGVLLAVGIPTYTPRGLCWHTATGHQSVPSAPVPLYTFRQPSANRKQQRQQTRQRQSMSQMNDDG